MPRRLRSAEAVALGVVALAAAAAGVLAVGLRGEGGGRAEAAWSPGPPARPARPETATTAGLQLVVLRAPSLASLASSDGAAGGSRAAARLARARAAQAAAVSALRRLVPSLRPEVSLVEVLDAFSARVGPADAVRLERSRLVAGVYPVRVALAAPVPAASPAGRATAPDVRVAIVAPRRLLVPLASVVRADAPGAGLLPVAVGDRWARGDVLLAGLERAVDPNGDGDVGDRARVALLGAVEPFAAFRDGPGAAAVAGAARLGTLVVVPAGNDGPAAPGASTLAGPGAGGAGLTAGSSGAAAAAPLVARAGTRIVLAETAGIEGDVPRTIVLGRGSRLGAGPGIAVPGGRVLLSAGGARTLAEAGQRVVVVLGPRTTAGGARAAAFSSTGPGAMLLAPGAGGTGAAAAVVAAAAARLAAAEPALGPSALRARLLAHPPAGLARLVLRPAGRRPAVLRGVTVTPRAFAPSDRHPAVVRVVAGAASRTAEGEDVRSLRRLDVRLLRDGRPVGTLARLRDLLPGTYALGLTGRGPDGRVLPPGGYTLAVVAWPEPAGPPVVTAVSVTLRARQ